MGIFQPDPLKRLRTALRAFYDGLRGKANALFCVRIYEVCPYTKNHKMKDGTSHRILLKRFFHCFLRCDGVVRKSKIVSYQRNDNNFAVCYYRFSSESQSEISIEKQKRHCRRHAEEHGYTIIDEFEDRAKSGLDFDRSGFMDMMEKIDAVRPCALIIYKLDRFGRNLVELVNYERQIDEMGCFLETVKEKYVDPNDPEAPRYRGTQWGEAESYSRVLSANIRDGNEEAASNCWFLGHKVFGYDGKAQHPYTINEEQAPIVIKIFSDYADGKPMKQIAEELNKCGFRTNSDKEWTHNGLRSILRNRKYTGVYQEGDIVVPGGMPAIISEELFEQAQSRMQKNRHQGTSKVPVDVEPRYWLTGKLYCGYCKERMSGMSGTSETGKKYYYYRCTTKGCDKKNITKEDIEAQVEFVLKQLIKDSGSVAAFAIDKLEAYKASHPINTTVLDGLKDRERDIQKGIANIVKTIEQGVSSDALIDRLKELEAQKKQIAETIAVETIRQERADDEYSIRSYFEKYANSDLSDISTKKAMLDYFVDKIYVYDDYLKVLVWYSTGKKEIEFYENDGEPFLIWDDVGTAEATGGEQFASCASCSTTKAL